MEALKNFWNWFNGKKTNIGSALMIIATFLPDFKQEFLIGIWHLQVPFVFDQTVQSLAYFGALLALTGLGHKLKKAQP